MYGFIAGAMIFVSHLSYLGYSIIEYMYAQIF